MEENQAPQRPSGLKPPMKVELPSSPSSRKPTRFEPPSSPPPRMAGLSEMNETAINARGAMGPPAGGSIKHRPTGLPEPPFKRKTLMDRAGEAYNAKKPAPASSQSVNSAVNSVSANGARKHASSTSRLPGKQFKHASTTSFGASVGHGPRATSANGNGPRPKSAVGAHMRTKSHNQLPRSATAMADHDDERSSERKVLDEQRVESLMRHFDENKDKFERTMEEQMELKISIKVMESRITELEEVRAKLKEQNDSLTSELNETSKRITTLETEREFMRREHSYEVDDLRRKHRNEMEDVQDRQVKDSERMRRENDEAADRVRKEFESQIEKLLKMHSEELDELKKKLESELEDERKKTSREADSAQAEYAAKLRDAGLQAVAKEQEAQVIQGELTNVKAELDRERTLKNGLQGQLTEATTNNIALDAASKAMKEKIDFLESDSQAQSQAFNDLHRRMQEAIEAAELANEKLRQEETLRRKLHNQVQELKGNIRVMCRVRPTHESEPEPAKIGFPDSDADSREVAVQGPERQSATGKDTTATYSYAFDRVFAPSSQNAEVFEEISQLVQSALDGYNVCIFCYGQTGSGKTYTMSSDDGMIPRATAQIWNEAQRLEEKGWKYTMEGSFVEVYNETYNDLLGRSEDIDKKKVEVRHDMVKKQTTLENTVSVVLDGPGRVEEILQTASKNRTVAATKANMRSSRSHSVFILKLVGHNSITGEKSEGTLNLVDLAGSERLEHSKAEGTRLKETQNINKSLSCLGDVINALGSAKEGAHVPYRNSKLTYLLQYSLGGNSKTLMFVMVSPLQAHLQETITSLKFATKVHNTHIGTAKKQTKA